MDPIDVTAHWSVDGQVTPISFTWHGEHFTVESVGRRWEDGPHLHALVMVFGGQVYELVFSTEEKRWFLGYRADRTATV